MTHCQRPYCHGQMFSAEDDYGDSVATCLQCGRSTRPAAILSIEARLADTRREPLGGRKWRIA